MTAVLDSNKNAVTSTTGYVLPPATKSEEAVISQPPPATEFVNANYNPYQQYQCVSYPSSLNTCTSHNFCKQNGFIGQYVQNPQFPRGVVNYANYKQYSQLPMYKQQALFNQKVCETQVGNQGDYQKFVSIPKSNEYISDSNQIASGDSTSSGVIGPENINQFPSHKFLSREVCYQSTVPNTENYRTDEGAGNETLRTSSRCDSVRSEAAESSCSSMDSQGEYMFSGVQPHQMGGRVCLSDSQLNELDNSDADSLSAKSEPALIPAQNLVKVAPFVSAISDAKSISTTNNGGNSTGQCVSRNRWGNGSRPPNMSHVFPVQNVLYRNSPNSTITAAGSNPRSELVPPNNSNLLVPVTSQPFPSGNGPFNGKPVAPVPPVHASGHFIQNPSYTPNSSSTVIVPLGWQRIVTGDSVTYYR